MKITFKEFLIEKRKNPSMNPKHKNIDVLEKYKDDPDVYITFVNIQKVGINPKSSYDTPNGIYTYPLKEYWKKINKASNIGAAVPFAGHAKYIAILKYVGTGRFPTILDKDYTDYDFNNDLKKIEKMIVEKKYVSKDRLNITLEDLEMNKDKFNNPIDKLWFVLNELVKLMSDNKKSQIKSNILRNLGFDGLADKTGLGLIHPNEPIQAFFLKKSVIKIIDFIDNK